MADFLTELFGSNLPPQEEVTASLESAKELEAARLANLASQHEDLRLRQITNRCPRCMGAGKVAQFTYRANGVCFQCGGSGMI